MKNIEQDIRKLVNVNKVFRAVKDQSWFALYSKDSENNLLITRNFILNLTSEQFWKIQCKLEAKRIGVWFFMSKEGLVEDEPVNDLEVNSYFRLVNRSDLEIIEHTDLSLGGLKLYEAEGQYVGVRSSYVDMLNGLVDLYQADVDSPLVAAGVHMIVPTREIESNYLASLMLK
ncbi:hypothetical protein [Pelosinus sp. IPA-1]|uniref:hypothetical protein n=1 Tax=Pelosinus sp. IPA-1 TaxID=3029569 RepID=UPI0024361C88|nr:hypothetical protein [Pelosinus sp. IPA-1]GMB00898.1 hypothetical protein PIPA1_36970 [Pelosinus sp. IPA-1]